MILHVLRATLEELGASAFTYHQDSFHAILIFVHASLRVTFNLVTGTLLSAYIYH